MATNRTFTMIKPDGVENGHTGAILDKINSAGFRIVAMKKTQMTRYDAESFYAVHNERAKSLTNSRYEKAFNACMQDDFNTPGALSVLFDMAKDIFKCKAENAELAGQLAGLMVRLAGSLGIVQQNPEAFLKGGAEKKMSDEQIESLIKTRDEARADKNWAKADDIRDRLQALNIILEDGSPGSTGWRKG